MRNHVPTRYSGFLALCLALLPGCAHMNSNVRTDERVSVCMLTSKNLEDMKCEKDWEKAFGVPLPTKNKMAPVAVAAVAGLAGAAVEAVQQWIRTDAKKYEAQFSGSCAGGDFWTNSGHGPTDGNLFGAPGAHPWAGQYFYLVTVQGVTGESDYVADMVVSQDTGAGQLNRIAWLSVDNATGYRIYRGTRKNERTDFHLLKTVDGTENSYVDNGGNVTLGANPPVSNTSGLIMAPFHVMLEPSARQKYWGFRVTREAKKGCRPFPGDKPAFDLICGMCAPAGNTSLLQIAPLSMTTNASRAKVLRGHLWYYAIPPFVWPNVFCKRGELETSVTCELEAHSIDKDKTYKNGKVGTTSICLPGATFNKSLTWKQSPDSEKEELQFPQTVYGWFGGVPTEATCEAKESGCFLLKVTVTERDPSNAKDYITLVADEVKGMKDSVKKLIPESK